MYRGIIIIYFWEKSKLSENLLAFFYRYGTIYHREIMGTVMRKDIKP